MAKNSETFQLTLPSDLEFCMSREFDAPRELVFDCWTKPEHVRRWWGCNGSELSVCDIDLRVGGKFRYVVKMGEQEFGFNGVYQEVVRPELLVHTYIFEPMPEHDSLVTVTFEETGSRTKVSETIKHKSKESRDGHINSGMEGGARESYDRLEELLGSI